MKGLPRSVEDLGQAIEAEERRLGGLSLQAPDAGDLDLSCCAFNGGYFKEGRFGHACRAPISRR